MFGGCLLDKPFRCLGATTSITLSSLYNLLVALIPYICQLSAEQFRLIVNVSPCITDALTKVREANLSMGCSMLSLPPPCLARDVPIIG